METKIIKIKQHQEKSEKLEKLFHQKRKLTKYSSINSLNLKLFLMCFFVCFDNNNCFLFKKAEAMPLLHLLRMYRSSNNNNQNVNPNGLLFTNTNYFYHPNQNNQRLNYLGNTLLRMKSNNVKYDEMKKRSNNNIFNNQALDDDNDAIVAGLLRQERNEMNAGAPKMYAQNIGELGSTMFRFG
ncbi:unnamed protein product [Meloidogyne enterolobii]|uniref:Uncharacterized protein n=1 Tax=Meloidogyne enterolobii TaxID=390850 RepID=A0ACB0YJ30_MELEN